MAYNMPEVVDTYRILIDQFREVLKVELDEGRIKATEYADALKQLLGEAMRLAMDVPIKGEQVELYKKDLELKDKDLQLKDKDLQLKLLDMQLKEKQKDLMDQDLMNKAAQEKLTLRQIDGFDQDVMRKMLDLQMNAWAMMFSSGLLEEKPSIIANDEVSSLYYKLLSEV